jgi:hypothetical protein
MTLEFYLSSNYVKVNCPGDKKWIDLF